MGLIDLRQKNEIECPCGFYIPNSNKDLSPKEDLDKYLNVTCPECSENLLTEEEYLDYKNNLKFFKRINKWFGWLNIFATKKEKERLKDIYNGKND